MRISIYPLLLLSLLAAFRVLLYLNKRSDMPAVSYVRVQKEQSLLEKRIYALYPSPHADLLLGMTIGSETIKNQKIFYQNLISTNTVHVVVVSGYNVALLIDLLCRFMPNALERRREVLLVLVVSLYAILCGLQPPVVRASLMGYISSVSRARGRPVAAIYMLWLTCALMVLVTPANILSLSFWLSALSSFGLVAFESRIKKMLDYITVHEIVTYFSTSFVCQLVVWPLISYKFSRVNLLGPMYNVFILWLVPVCTILGGVALLVSFLPLPFSLVVSFLIYPFFDLFVFLINLLSKVKLFDIGYTLPLIYMLTYYLVVALFAYKNLFVHSSSKRILTT